MNASTMQNMDAAQQAVHEVRLALASVAALLQARERHAEPSEPGNVIALDLTREESYGLGILVGVLVDQLSRAEQELAQALKAQVVRAS